uniref:Uncharacterized protein ycf35 n=1 Tax=Ophidocladus simpliciusculus TaxID=1261574 RepID=A0A1Z1MJA0_9FLOR|nr:hypothetical protein [Ophidocladus simpliciusculus]ARW65922.1 hypothetical protein [Ophidocladus simpliciusculus]
MSHFSKIKTNITNLDILTKTIRQLGFNYSYLNSQIDLNSTYSLLDMKNILVYDSYSKNTPLFSFVWNSHEYNLVVDLQANNIDIDINYFMDRLSQQYAYNIVVEKSNSNGFHKVNEIVGDDGSIKITLQRWSNHSVY